MLWADKVGVYSEMLAEARAEATRHDGGGQPGRHERRCGDQRAVYHQRHQPGDVGDTGVRHGSQAALGAAPATPALRPARFLDGAEAGA